MSPEMESFLTVLETMAPACDWALVADGAIRTRPVALNACPLTFMCGSPGVMAYELAGQGMFGLTRDEANDIANAADGEGPFSPWLRERLLTACGLSE